jgi:hypothetical protein
MRSILVSSAVLLLTVLGTVEARDKWSVDQAN